MENMTEYPDWIPKEITKIIDDVNKIKQNLYKHNGILPPEANTKALGFISCHHSTVLEFAGISKAQRDEYFARLLQDYLKMSIGKAEAMAKGSIFGMQFSFYEQLAAGYNEMIQTFKKHSDYHNKIAQNQY